MSDGGLGKALTLNGGGKLILSGTNSYGGGTVVNAGTLVVTNKDSLPDGSRLTVARRRNDFRPLGAHSAADLIAGRGGRQSRAGTGNTCPARHGCNWPLGVRVAHPESLSRFRRIAFPGHPMIDGPTTTSR